MDENYLIKLFPKLKGIDLSLVSNKVDPSSPENLFYSDIDGEWYFITMNFPMIFKAFSDETIDEELKCLLEANNIKNEDYFESAGIKMWNGDGFKIECPPNSVGPNKNMIMITNDNLVPVDVGIEELRTTDISEEVDMPEGYDSIINGIDHIYNGEEFLESNNGSLGVNIPLLFIDQDNGLPYIIIGVPSLPIGIKIIDDIIEKNYGKSNFTSLEENEKWAHIYKNKFYSIGFMKDYSCVRINIFHNLTKI